MGPQACGPLRVDGRRPRGHGVRAVYGRGLQPHRYAEHDHRRRRAIIGIIVIGAWALVTKARKGSANADRERRAAKAAEQVLSDDNASAAERTVALLKGTPFAGTGENDLTNTTIARLFAGLARAKKSNPNHPVNLDTFGALTAASLDAKSGGINRAASQQMVLAQGATLWTLAVGIIHAATYMTGSLETAKAGMAVFFGTMGISLAAALFGLIGHLVLKGLYDRIEDEVSEHLVELGYLTAEVIAPVINDPEAYKAISGQLA